MIPWLLAVGWALAADTDVTEGVLASDSYSFCHEVGADADQLERWCALLEHAPADACPAMRETCEGGVFEAAPSGCDGLSGGAGGSEPAPAPEPGEAPWQPPESCQGTSCDAPELGGLAVLFRWLVAAAVAALVLVVARYLIRWWGRDDDMTFDTVVDAVVAEAEVPVEGDDDLPLLPEETLLQHAEAALAAGQLGEAVVYARGAALRRLARRGRLILQRARTDREYLRTVSDAPDLHTDLASVVQAVEDHRWAERALAQDVATEAVRAARRLLTTLAVLVCVVLPADAFGARRYAPEGDAALFDVLRAEGYTLYDGTASMADIDDDVDVAIIDNRGVFLDAEAWTALRGWVERGGVLITGGEPSWFDDEEEGDTAAEQTIDVGDWTGFSAVAHDDAVTRGLARKAGIAVPRWPEAPAGQWCYAPGERLIVVPKAAPRDVAEGREDCPVPVLMQALEVGEGWVIVLTDTTIWRNAAMVVPANRAFLPALLRAGSAHDAWNVPSEAVVWVATRSFASSDAAPPAVARPRVLVVVLHVFLLWLLASLWRGWPMSPLRAAPPELRRDASEHARALGRHWEVVGARRHAAAAHARLALHRHGRVGLERIASAAGWSTDRTVAWLDHLESLADDPEGPEHPNDVSVVEDLWKMLHPPTR